MKNSTAGLLAGTTFVAGAGAGLATMAFTDTSLPIQTNAEGWDKVDQVRDLIEEHSLQDISEDDLLTGALDGMTAALNDPYSDFLDAEETSQFTDSIESSFEGIGATLEKKGEDILIVAPIKGAPAEEAGLRPGDIITAVDGESIEGMDVQEAVQLIRGEKGTTVTLTIRRGSQTADYEIIRDTIPIETVFSEVKEKDGKKIGYLQVTQFSEPTADEFLEQLEQLESEEIDSLIIDVRGNPGGLLPAVIEMSEGFVPTSKPVVQIENADGDRDAQNGRAREAKPYDLFVLTDEGSASASEILTGAMKEGAGATIIGTKTFGKGVVQTAFDLEDGSNLKLTTSKWLTPDGNWINKKGIEPDIEVEQPDFFNVTRVLTEEESLQVGDYGDAVSNLHKILTGIGYEPGGQPGYYGDTMANAVKAFQTDNGLEASGTVDEETASALEAKLLEAIQDEANDAQLNRALEEAAK
ncbi:S41 family peptidase [Exiguobacterium profundum]|uniref:S41 family peptidase n=1 Tax=Exiguobacterium TaxID=33986 RepID=UPI0006498353|nr:MULTISPECIES: S41 family peptidase [unclassified Exiguobacterium]MCT4798050.1 S41 family peptidase [Exiguobacterium profundum]QPI68507.1 S41 family peptidase [Exiguobacterium sp. PBE]MDT0192189.1 S41 family peptidase [Exiguobacterium sp. BG5(2022)]VXB46237.1 PDZ-containing carboxyl-terminal protease processing protease (Zn(II)) [Exiguobacterium sp. 8A]VXB47686.1 PDZ-containing carboxyl-terminal protease processing protease (Zn(II)) [Exiguobacterium sp. 8H]